MTNLFYVNGGMVDSGGVESYFDGGTVLTFRQDVRSASPQTNVLIFRQSVGWPYEGGTVMTFRQDVRYRSTFVGGDVLVFKQDVRYKYSGGNALIYRQRVYDD